jgi:SCAMP family
MWANLNIFTDHGGVLLLNVLGGLTLLFYDGRFVTFCLSIFYVFLFTPISFLCWYRPAYKAFRFAFKKIYTSRE